MGYLSSKFGAHSDVFSTTECRFKGLVVTVLILGGNSGGCFFVTMVQKNEHKTFKIW